MKLARHCHLRRSTPPIILAFNHDVHNAVHSHIKCQQNGIIHNWVNNDLTISNLAPSVLRPEVYFNHFAPPGTHNAPVKSSIPNFNTIENETMSYWWFKKLSQRVYQKRPLIGASRVFCSRFHTYCATSRRGDSKTTGRLCLTRCKIYGRLP